MARTSHHAQRDDRTMLSTDRGTRGRLPAQTSYFISRSNRV
jgi:hypothetical protein